MEGKVIKEESVSSVGSPCSPLALPSGKENRRVGSPLSSSEILTRSRSKVLSKENSHHHHHHHHSHHHRMSESPKGGSPSPPITVNLSFSSGKNLSTSGGGQGSSNLSHHHHSGGGHSGSSSHGFHQFSSPHSTTPSSAVAVSISGSISNGSVLRERSPTPPLNVSNASSTSLRDRDRDRDGSLNSSNNSSTNLNTSGSNNSSAAAARTPSSSSNNSSNSSAGSANSLGQGGCVGNVGGNSRLLIKIKRFLGTLLHFGCDISPDVGERVRTLVFNLVTGHLSIEEFHHTLQEVTSFPLRPFVLPFLRAHLPLLQRELNHLARIAKQSPLSYVQTHEQVIIDTGSSPGEPCDIFHSEASDLSIPNKRKAHDSFYENGELSSESSGYSSTPKRHHGVGSIFSSAPFFLAGGSSSADFRDYYPAAYSLAGSASAGSQHHSTSGGGSVSHSTLHHEVLQPSQASTPSNGVHKGGPEDEWKNIHVMLNCILSMVEKTKRALGILQTRAVHSDQVDPSPSSSWLRRPSMYSALESSEDIKRQVSEMMAQAFRATEDRVSEVKRRAEEAVQEVKRQALVELKRAVAAAESRACEAVASERARLERVLIESRRTPSSVVAEIGTPMIVGAPSIESEACWNCGRKAHETCSGCNTARYCSSFCQHKDWENHHAVCGRSTSSTNGLDRDRERSSAGSGPNSIGTAGDNKSSHLIHPHHHDSSNSSPINVSNPSPENHSPRSNN